MFRYFYLDPAYPGLFTKKFRCEQGEGGKSEGRVLLYLE